MIPYEEARKILEGYREDKHDRELVDFISDYDLSGENTKNYPQSELFRAVYCYVQSNGILERYKYLMKITEIEEAEDSLL
jgi:hypothetical protein